MSNLSLVKVHLAEAISYLEAIIHVHESVEWRKPDTKFWESVCAERIEWARDALRHPQ